MDILFNENFRDIDLKDLNNFPSNKLCVSVNNNILKNKSFR